MVQVLEQAEERKRRAKYEDIQNTLFEQSQADRNTRLAREAEDYEFKLDERYGEDDVAGAVESLSPFLKHSTMGQGPFSGPTARGPGGEVGVPRGPEVDEDPIVSAISAASRPHLKRASDGRLRNPATSAAARARTEQLGDFQMERTARREDAEHAASLRPPPAAPAPRAPSYQRIVGPDGRVRLFDPATRETIDTGQNERVPAAPNGPAIDDSERRATWIRNRAQKYMDDEMMGRDAAFARATGDHDGTPDKPTPPAGQPSGGGRQGGPPNAQEYEAKLANITRLHQADLRDNPTQHAELTQEFNDAVAQLKLKYGIR